MLVIEIDFNSDEALYMQLRNQIIMGIANSMVKEGESLPSVRELAEEVGINMHTVNKAYNILKQEGYLKLDRRKGAVIAVEADECRAKNELMNELKVLVAKAICHGVRREDVNELVNDIYQEYEDNPEE